MLQGLGESHAACKPAELWHYSPAPPHHLSGTASALRLASSSAQLLHALKGEVDVLAPYLCVAWPADSHGAHVVTRSIHTDRSLDSAGEEQLLVACGKGAGSLALYQVALGNEKQQMSQKLVSVACEQQAHGCKPLTSVAFCKLQLPPQAALLLLEAGSHPQQPSPGLATDPRLSQSSAGEGAVLQLEAGQRGDGPSDPRSSMDSAAAAGAQHETEEAAAGAKPRPSLPSAAGAGRQTGSCAGAQPEGNAMEWQGPTPAAAAVLLYSTGNDGRTKSWRVSGSGLRQEAVPAAWHAGVHKGDHRCQACGVALSGNGLVAALISCNAHQQREFK